MHANSVMVHALNVPEVITLNVKAALVPTYLPVQHALLDAYLENILKTLNV